jgi:hypothetical protein
MRSGQNPSKTLSGEAKGRYLVRCHADPEVSWVHRQSHQFWLERPRVCEEGRAACQNTVDTAHVNSEEQLQNDLFGN